MRNLAALHEANETRAIGEDTSGRLPTFRSERARRGAQKLYEAIIDRRHFTTGDDLGVQDLAVTTYALGAIRGTIIFATETGDTATEHAAKVLLQRLNDRGLDGLDEFVGTANALVA